MRFKQFYTNHKRLCGVLLSILIAVFFWGLTSIIVCLFCPKSEAILFAPEPPTITIAAPTVAIIELPATTPSPSLTPEPVQPPRYGFTDDDIYLMAVLLTGSKDVSGDGEFDFDYGRQDEYDQISLVLCVVMNRVRSTIYPNTVSEVIWQKRQFSGMYLWKNKLPQVSDISLQRVTEWCNAYDAYDTGVQTIPEDHLYFSGDGRNNHSR